MPTQSQRELARRIRAKQAQTPTPATTETTTPAETITELDPATLDPMTRTVNKGLMVRWINADLFNRANYDVRHSIALLDDTQMFVSAMPIPPTEGQCAALYQHTSVRYWTRGV